MAKNILLSFILILAFSTISFGQGKDDITTFIIVRHAEKVLDNKKDPNLSPEGKERARKLMALLHEAKITAVYSTPYKRTFETVNPLAKSKNLDVSYYEPTEFSVFKDVLKANNEKVILVAGHSNTVNEIVNYLTGTNAYQALGEDEFDRLFIVSANAVGNASVLELRY